jgi:hypothetical protein
VSANGEGELSRSIDDCSPRSSQAAEGEADRVSVEGRVPGGAGRVKVPAVTLFSRRLPHVLTRADLVRVLLETYVDAMAVEDDEALDRLTRAIDRDDLRDAIYDGISGALSEAQGERTSEDQLMDKLGKGVQKRRSRVRAAPSHAGIAAVLVRINVELGLVPEPMRATLETEKGRALLEDGLRRLGRHVVDELLR